MIGREPHNDAADQVTLDELTALCDLMVSLSRAGIPLDRGLVQLAQDLPGRLSTQAIQISQRLQAGQSLADVVSSDDTPFPPVYKSVVEAGLRSGRTTVALEGFARLARQIAELRALVASALVYPMVLMVVVGVVSFFVLRRLGPVLRSEFLTQRPRTSPQGWNVDVMAAAEVFSQWFWLIPAGMFLLGILWWQSTRRATAAQPGRLADWSGWVPGAGRLLRNSRMLAFSEVLGLLVRQQVPLDQALRLAGSASGDRNLGKDAEQLADRIHRGETGRGETGMDRPPRGGIPPFLRWSLANGQRIGRLESTIERASETYRRRTEDAAAWLRTFVPIIFTFCFGGLVTLLYAGTVFVPWYTILHSLAEPWEAL